MPDPWCMYQFKNGVVINDMFLPHQIPEGWYDSPKAAKKGGDDWNATQKKQEQEEKDKPTKEDLDVREADLDCLSEALKELGEEQEARDSILDKREVALKLREDALEAKLSDKVDGRSKAGRALKAKADGNSSGSD